jgi:Tfp pilus assembly protein PilN
MAYPIKSSMSVGSLPRANSMVGIAMLLCALGFAASGRLLAADVIAVEKLSKDQLRQALQAASPDTMVEYQGQSKTLAEWRAYYQAQFKSLDGAQLKQQAAERKAKIEAAAKALKDDQDKSIAEENARVMKEYEELNSR